MDTEPLFASIRTRQLFEGEFWWTVRRYETQAFYAFGIEKTPKAALNAAREAANRLRKEIENGE